jgi:hypothetical protein
VVKYTKRWARNGLFNIPKTICWNCGLDEYMIYVSYRVYDPQKLMKNLDISGMSWEQHPWVGNGSSCGSQLIQVIQVMKNMERLIQINPISSVKDMKKFMEIWNIYEYLQIHILNSFAWLGIDGIWTIRDY